MFNKIKNIRPGLNKIEIKTWIPSFIFIFIYTKDIKDPEFPYSLYILNILNIEKIFINISTKIQKISIIIIIVPTYNLCSMTSVIGLSIKIFLLKKLFIELLSNQFPINWIWNFYIDIPSNMHANAFSLVKQLNDQERTSAAVENLSLRNIIKICYSKK